MSNVKILSDEEIETLRLAISRNQFNAAICDTVIDVSGQTNLGVFMRRVSATLDAYRREYEEAVGNTKHALHQLAQAKALASQRTGWRPDPSVQAIVSHILQSQQARIKRLPPTVNGIAPDHAEAHAHVATFIDLWNRYVCRIDGLDENSLPSAPEGT